jgi:hypothetical protein
MRLATTTLVWLLAALLADAQEPAQGPAGPVPGCAGVPACESSGGSPHGLHWMDRCFPRCGCPDDYCRHPYAPPCWPPYPPFYLCVPAGHCAHPPCVGVGNEGLTWWFIPTPRALREAIWCQP